MLFLMRHGPTLVGLRWRLRWWLLALLFIGLVILAHGCHGPDEDHEL